MVPKTVTEMLVEFHVGFDHPAGNAVLPSAIPEDDPNRMERLEAAMKLLLLRETLLREETNETLIALTANDAKEILDGICDVVYVAVGMAVVYGMDFDAAFKHVHQTNMAKLGQDGKPVKRDDGKILKPEGWEPPDVTPYLNPQAFRYKYLSDKAVSRQTQDRMISVLTQVSDLFDLAGVCPNAADDDHDQSDCETCRKCAVQAEVEALIGDIDSGIGVNRG